MLSTDNLQHQLSKFLIQPVKPGSTLDVFIAADELAEKSNLGQLFVLVEIQSRERGLKEKIKELFNLVQNEYYSSPTPNIESSLEITCQNLNLNFREIINKPEIWYKKVNILIGVIKDNLITFTHLGQFSGYLIRSNKVTQILNTQTNNHEETFFSQLTTGEIKAGDILILSDYTLFDFFSLEKIKKIATKLNAEQTTCQLKNLIMENVKIPEIVSIIIKSDAQLLETENQISPETQTKKYLQELYGSQESLEQLENLKQRTGRTLGFSLWPNFKKIKKSIISNHKKLNRKKDLKLPPETKPKKIISHIKKINLPAWPTINFKNNLKWIIIILVIIFAGSLLYLNFYQKIKQEKTRNQTILSQVDEQKSQAEAALIYQDTEKANELLTAALKELESLDWTKNKWSTLGSIRQQEVTKLLNKINSIFENPAQIAAEINTGQIIKFIKDKNDKIYLLDNSGKIYLFENNTLSNFLTQATVKNFTFLEKDNSLLYLTPNNKFYIQNKDKTTELNLNLLKDALVVDLRIYGERAYLLDNLHAIYKIGQISTANPTIEIWYADDKNLVNKAKEIYVDGNIWVNSLGKIYKLYRGKKQNFEITKLSQPLGSEFTIYTEEDWQNIFILDKQNSRLVVTDKNGVTQKQFINPELKNAEKLIVDNSGKTIWFSVGGKIWTMELKEE